MSCHDTQNDRLLAEFKRRRYLTMRDIFDKLHINNPWARISELRKRHRIKDDFVKTKGGARIKVYWLAEGRKRAA
jgi:hypothetical protein